MAEFSDIFIAKNTNEATQYKILEPNLPHINTNGLTDYEISALWASIENSHVKRHHELAYIDTDTNAVLYQLPEVFKTALAALSDEDITSVAILWAEYEELHWRKPEAIDKIKELRELATKARESKQQLYFILI